MGLIKYPLMEVIRSYFTRFWVSNCEKATGGPLRGFFSKILSYFTHDSLSSQVSRLLSRTTYRLIGDVISFPIFVLGCRWVVNEPLTTSWEDYTRGFVPYFYTCLYRESCYYLTAGILACLHRPSIQTTDVAPKDSELKTSLSTPDQINVATFLRTTFRYIPYFSHIHAASYVCAAGLAPHLHWSQIQGIISPPKIALLSILVDGMARLSGIIANVLDDGYCGHEIGFM